MKKIVLSVLVLLSVLWASVDLNSIYIKPEFMKPGVDMGVTILSKKVIETPHNVKPIKMIAVISNDDTWSDDDLLFLYDGGKNQEPMANVDGAQNVYVLDNSEWFEGWFEYTWPTIVPNSFMHGEKKFIIVRIAEGNPNWDMDLTVASMEGKWSKELAVEFEVAENKVVIYNTAYVEDKSDTAKFTISKGLPDAFLEATPPGQGLAGIGTETVFQTPTLDVTLKTTEKLGAKIYYTKGNKEVDITADSQLYDSTTVITLTGTDTVRAIAVVPGYNNKSGVWYYKQDFPELFIEADAGLKDTTDTLGFYFDTTVVLKAVDAEGNEVSDAKIYYLIDTTGSKGYPDDGDALYSETIVIDTTVTIRAVAYHDNYQPASGLWNYKLLLGNNWMKVHTSDSSYLGDSLILGDSILSEQDTAHFGHNLFVVIDYNSDSCSYTYKGDHIYNKGDTIKLTDADPDTVLIKAKAYGQGYTTVNMDLVFVRDTVEVLSADPAGHKFINSTKVVLSLDREWRNQTIWFDTAGSDMELYERPITIDTTKTLRAQAKADFAVESKLLSEEYLLANGVESAYYLDKNADGAIDAATLLFTRDLDELPSAVTLVSPFDESETLTATGDDLSKVDDRLLTVSFATPFSFTNSTAFEDAMLGVLSGDSFVEDSFSVQDSVAPVFLSAVYAPGEIISTSPVKRDDDKLSVHLSEKVSYGDKVSPFELKRGESTLYTLTLKDAELDGDKATFVVEEIHGVSYPEKGDSIHISIDADVSGEASVAQRNQENRFVPLDVLDIPYDLTILGITPVTPWEYEIPDELKSATFKHESGLLIVADFNMKMENSSQDGSIVIYDPVGNIIAQCDGRDKATENLAVDLIEDETTKVVFYWSGKNGLGRKVGGGKYIATVVVTDGRSGTDPHKEQVHLGVQVPLK